jgi:2-polyprenyl-3-methyl-5-hydroxy-6-metoxy-1,4-benzoquinol methylase
MTYTLEHKDGLVEIVENEENKRVLQIRTFDDNKKSQNFSCVTSYPVSLIQLLLDVKGPVWLCDEISRDEEEGYVQKYLATSTLSYVDEDVFLGKKILDFGCGSGSSTMSLARLFPKTRITGIDFVEQFLNVARSRAEHYNFKNVEFICSPDPGVLPKEIEKFDFVFLSAVFEHLLPQERRDLMPMLWGYLKPGGILFLNETPYRYFPVESHTTGGLPLINYFPDSLTLYASRYLSGIVSRNVTWKELLRMGIRGATTGEIVATLSNETEKPLVLKPNRLGIKDQSDIWYKVAVERALNPLKRLIIMTLYFCKKITFTKLTPYLSLAIQKEVLEDDRAEN